GRPLSIIWVIFLSRVLSTDPRIWDFFCNKNGRVSPIFITYCLSTHSFKHRLNHHGPMIMAAVETAPKSGLPP
ncbi:hypothetical protein, partial [Zoogloea sp. LCSB751]|uniref:hypothetical protein n=1 Tax=Zoogloea sp. LCSB751 TaxID=1965277 RepID=UPI001C1F8EB7